MVQNNPISTPSHFSIVTCTGIICVALASFFSTVLGLCNRWRRGCRQTGRAPWTARSWRCKSQTHWRLRRWSARRSQPGEESFINIFKKVEKIRKRKLETTWLMSVIMFSMKSLWPGGGPCSRGRRRPSRCPRAGSPAASRPAGPGSPGTRTACPPGMCLKDLFTGFVFVICYWCTWWRSPWCRRGCGEGAGKRAGPAPPPAGPAGTWCRCRCRYSATAGAGAG